MKNSIQLNSSEYFYSLDGLRGIALLFVMIEHLIPDKGYFSILAFGKIGVGLFFVLSGFLIGTILLKERYESITNGISKRSIIKKFYIRRSLRIFPVYYLLLVLLLIIGFPAFIYQDFFWFMTYTANIKLVVDQYTYWPASHFWTLSVEEQFYLIFPVLLFVVKPKHIIKLICAFIVIGMLSRGILHFKNNFYYDYFTFSQFDYFGFGLLLAYIRINKIEMHIKKYWLFVLILIHLTFASSYITFIGKSFVLSIVPLLPVIFFIVIYKSITDWNSNKILNNSFLRYTGKISYGMYLFHPFVPFLREHFIEISQPYLALTVDVILVYGIASFSFFLFEKPINNLKVKYAY